MTEKLTYNYAEAADIIGIVSPEWLQAHKTQLPHIEMGRKIGFSMEHLIAIRDMHEVLPSAGQPAAEVPQALLELKPRKAKRSA
jgi:hypothetical protein